MYTEQELNQIITAQDLQAHGLCVRGARMLWRDNMELTDGFTFEMFIKHGITVRQLAAIGHPYGITLINKVLNHAYE